MAKWFTYIRREKVPAKDAGINDGYWLYHRSYARGAKKKNGNPFLLANEWICSNLAWHLRLPIPPFALMRKGSSPRFFASLDFGGKETGAPDMRPEQVAKYMPREATGLVAFDVLIANPDRHAGNLRVDNADLPTRMEVLDHDRALLGWHLKNHGFHRLKHVNDRLGYCKGLSEADYHPIGEALTTSEYFADWGARISVIPDTFIDEICNETSDLQISQELIEDTAFFLRERKRRVCDLINANRKFFRSIKRWGPS